MDPDPCIHAQRVLRGVAEIEGGSIRSAGAGANGKESALSVIEVLDEVCHPSGVSCTED